MTKSIWAITCLTGFVALNHNGGGHHSSACSFQDQNPQASGYFCCVQYHFEQQEMFWQDRYFTLVYVV